jgi:phage tail-like protein
MSAPPPISPHPLGATLPALYLEDVFAQNLCASLDEVLAPAISVLDCFPAYLDPRTAPPDMLDWLASWTGLLAARKLPVARRRRLVARAAALHAWRGTPDAVRELVELACNRPVDLEESGGSGWSVNPGTPLPGSDRPELVVRVRTTGVLDRPDEAADAGDGAGAGGPDEAEPAGAPVDADLLGRLLELVVPAHLPVRVELMP